MLSELSIRLGKTNMGPRTTLCWPSQKSGFVADFDFFGAAALFGEPGSGRKRPPATRGPAVSFYAPPVDGVWRLTRLRIFRRSHSFAAKPATITIANVQNAFKSAPSIAINAMKPPQASQFPGLH